MHEVSARFATERSERQQRRELVARTSRNSAKPDFSSQGFQSTKAASGRACANRRVLCELRTLAHEFFRRVGLRDASDCARLLASQRQVPAPFQAAWEAQRRRIFQTVCEGAWWGTIASEPGSGGDVTKTQAIARPGPTDGVYRLTGQKAFGSGSGMTSYMLTIAMPEGEPAPDVFFLDMRNVVWDGTAG